MDDTFHLEHRRVSGSNNHVQPPTYEIHDISASSIVLKPGESVTARNPGNGVIMESRTRLTAHEFSAIMALQKEHAENHGEGGFS